MQRARQALVQTSLSQAQTPLAQSSQLRQLQRCVQAARTCSTILEAGAPTRPSWRLTRSPARNPCINSRHKYAPGVGPGVSSFVMQTAQALAHFFVQPVYGIRAQNLRAWGRRVPAGDPGVQSCYLTRGRAAPWWVYPLAAFAARPGCSTPGRARCRRSTTAPCLALHAAAAA